MCVCSAVTKHLLPNKAIIGSLSDSRRWMVHIACGDLLAGISYKFHAYQALTQWTFFHVCRTCAYFFFSISLLGRLIIGSWNVKTNNRSLVLFAFWHMECVGIQKRFEHATPRFKYAVWSVRHFSTDANCN